MKDENKDKAVEYKEPMRLSGIKINELKGYNDNLAVGDKVKLEVEAEISRIAIDEWLPKDKQKKEIGFAVVSVKIIGQSNKEDDEEIEKIDKAKDLDELDKSIKKEKGAENDEKNKSDK